MAVKCTVKAARSTSTHGTSPPLDMRPSCRRLAPERSLDSLKGLVAIHGAFWEIRRSVDNSFRSCFPLRCSSCSADPLSLPTLRLLEVAMRCLRIYASPDGEFHFGEVDIPATIAPLFPNDAPFGLSVHHFGVAVQGGRDAE